MQESLLWLLRPKTPVVIEFQETKHIGVCLVSPQLFLALSLQCCVKTWGGQIAMLGVLLVPLTQFTDRDCILDTQSLLFYSALSWFPLHLPGGVLLPCVWMLFKWQLITFSCIIFNKFFGGWHHHISG